MLGNSDLHNEPPLLNVRTFETIGDSTGFLRAAGHLLDWGSASGRIVLDIGCGDGRSSAAILSVFPDIEKVIAIDDMPTRIDEAKRKHPHSKIKYHLADIEDKNTLSDWAGNIWKIVSFKCFNFVNNDLQAFWNVFHLMGYGGTAAVLLLTSSPFYDVLEQLTEHEEWADYLMEAYKIIPKSHMMNCRDIYYKNLLRSIGFEIIMCKEMEICFTYSSNEECREALFAACPLARVLPSNRKEEFMDYTFKLFMEQDTSPKTLQELPYLKQRTVSILFRKPVPRIYASGLNTSKSNLD